MQKRVFGIFILLLGLLLMNVAEALVVNDHFMTLEVPSQNCVPPTPTISFSVDDARAYSWIVYSGFTAGDRIDWEFIAPDGSLFDIYAVSPPPSNPTNGCTWGWMDIASQGAPAGVWYVDVYVNNVYEFTDFFEITRKKACPVTAVYGERSTETELLRSIRDNLLSQSREGRELIKLYYQWSPFIVKAMEADDQFKQEIKNIIDEVLVLFTP